jgi:glutaminyl-tRNA synthetase
MLRQLVEEGYVRGWDDPRMPTLRGLRRRGYTPQAILDFIQGIGVTKSDGFVDTSFLDYCLRQDLNKHAQRRMVVLDPIKVVLTNYPQGKVEDLTAINNPEDESAGTRQVPFSREIYIEREDFMEQPVKKFYRLAPGREVRLRYAYFITCTDVIKDESGNIEELRCIYDPDTRGGDAPDGRRVKATLHWVSARHAIDAEVRLYDHLFIKENPLDLKEGEDWLEGLNPESVKVLTGCKAEPTLGDVIPGQNFQFERKGYFSVDLDSSSGRPVFNRSVTLRDTWAKLKNKK